MSEILVVGSLAYDSIKTPEKKADRALGGSANYFSLAASLFAPVRVVGVVGEDYEDSDYELLKSRSVDLSGVNKVKGKTFHWEGEYKEDMNEAITRKTELNVFESFNPILPEHYQTSEFVFLANIAPELQLQVLEQVKKPRFVGSDTMNFWIQSKKSELEKVLKRVDVVLINEGESKQLTSASNAIEAAARIVGLGPKAVVIKRGEYGFAMYTKEGYFMLPAFPISKVVDPTGAGDTFAGGFFGYLASHKTDITPSTLKQACVNGCIMASFTIQDFSVGALKGLTRAAVDQRLAEYRKIISFN